MKNFEFEGIEIKTAEELREFEAEKIYTAEAVIDHKTGEKAEYGHSDVSVKLMEPSDVRFLLKGNDGNFFLAYKFDVLGLKEQKWQLLIKILIQINKTIMLTILNGALKKKILN